MLRYIHIKIRVDEKTRQSLKVKTARQGITMQEVLAKAVTEYLKAPIGQI